MKKTLIIVLALSILVASIAVAGVVSSKHDMRNIGQQAGRTVSSLGATTTQVCVFCHHPHRGAAATTSSVLLWNISDSANTYATYSSPTTNSAGDVGGDLSGDNAQYSLLCMGCHDGGSSNAYIQSKDLGDTPNLGSLVSNLGSTLVDDHPVDFTYPTAQAAGTGPDIRIATGTKVVGTVDYPLFGGTMQCATCHDVHNGNPGSTLQFMRGGTTNIITNSQICVDCHTAK